MLELLLGKRRAVATGLLLDIDFAGVALGTKTMVDKAQGIVLTMQGATASANTNFGVVDHPTAGRCFQFNGVNWFYNANSVLQDVSAGSYDLEVGYVKPSAAIAGNIVSSGIYANVSVNKPGFCLFLDQFPQTYIQLFVNRGDATFQRNMPAGTNPLTFQELLIEKRKNGMVIKNKTSGVNVWFPDFAITKDAELSIGGQAGEGALLTGYIKYIRIRKVVE